MGGSRSREREITPPTTKRREMTGAPNLNLKDCVGVRSRLEEREGEPPFLFVLDGGRRGGEKMAMGGVGERHHSRSHFFYLSLFLELQRRRKRMESPINQWHDCSLWRHLGHHPNLGDGRVGKRKRWSLPFFLGVGEFVGMQRGGGERKEEANFC